MPNVGSGFEFFNVGASSTNIFIDVTDNVLAGNGDFGAAFFGGSAPGSNSGAVFHGNKIGTNGTSLFPSLNAGVLFSDAANIQVGGTTAGFRNLISGNAGPGIEFVGTGSKQVVEGNFIGTNAAGTSALPNHLDGVLIEGAATGNTIGGSPTGARDLLSGNADDGIAIQGPGTTANNVSGDVIGLNAAGTARLPNGNAGGSVSAGASANVFQRNVFAGNAGDGLDLFGSATDGNVLEGNFFGLSAGQVIPNGGDGVFLGAGATENTIGGTTAGAGNTITGSSFDALHLHLFPDRFSAARHGPRRDRDRDRELQHVAVLELQDEPLKSKRLRAPNDKKLQKRCTSLRSTW